VNNQTLELLLATTNEVMILIDSVISLFVLTENVLLMFSIY